MRMGTLGRAALSGAFALFGPFAVAALHGQATGSSPRGLVIAHCYARGEIWEGATRTPFRLMYAKVSYNETTSIGVRRELSAEWSRFILPKFNEQARRPGQNVIVYCQYADSEKDTELAGWSAAISTPELVDWPGRSTTALAMPAPAPIAPAAVPVVVSPAATVARPVEPAPGTIPPASAPPPALVSVPGPTPTQGADEAAQVQQASAVYQGTLQRDAQIVREQQARDDAYRRQSEEYQRQMAAAQAAHREFQERQKQYDQEKAAYDAKLRELNGK